MQQKKQLQIGHSDFKSFVEANGYFVDKTLLIQEVIDAPFQVLVIPRPRRFGKSLNLSMLKYYFDIRGKDNLFKDYKIWQSGTKYKGERGKFPVIHISLKNGKALNFEDGRDGIYKAIIDVYREYAWLQEEDHLDKAEKEQFNAILGKIATSKDYEAALKTLSDFLFRYFGEKVYILFDEYDAPIHAAFNHGFYPEMIALMQSLMGNTFKDNIYLQKGVITGILRIAKESIFSDLNNPGIFTLLSTTFEDKFGFTTSEVKELLTNFEMIEDYEEVKKWYDGYTFGKAQHIYNPWSIVNYIALREDGFKTYWVNTSADELIKSRLLAKESESLREGVEKLIKGEVFREFIHENITFSDFHEDSELFWSLLVFAGYLSPVKKHGYNEFELKIPNFEIKILFKSIVMDWFKKVIKIRQMTLKSMTRCLVSNQMEEFERYFRQIMSDTFSYFDIHTEPERVYQAYLLGLLGIMSDDYIIKSNREAGKGRYDILLLPRTSNKYGVIFELKQLDTKSSDKEIKIALEDALEQIRERAYAQELEAHQIIKRIEVAVGFQGKEIHLKWKSFN
ncbi:MAG: AAA family ATPase [Bacteroidota bacterium]